MKLFTLRELRQLHGYSIHHVASRCGVETETMQIYEDSPGDILIPIGLAVKLGKLYEIPLDYIDWEIAEHKQMII
jgi:predicted transcriptional regulator